MTISLVCSSLEKDWYEKNINKEIDFSINNFKSKTTIKGVESNSVMLEITDESTITELKERLNK